MLNRLMERLNRRKTPGAGLAAAVLLISLFAWQYRQYAYAVAWHCFHGNRAQIGGHTVRLPILWWKEKAHARDTVDMQDHDEWFVRASPSGLTDRSEVDVSRAFPGEVADTDAEELGVTQRLVAGSNQNPLSSWSHSLVVVKAPGLTFYCLQDDLSLPGAEVLTDLSCLAPTLPYSLFYRGPKAHEEEAKAIIMTVQ